MSLKILKKLSSLFKESKYIMNTPTFVIKRMIHNQRYYNYMPKYVFKSKAMKFHSNSYLLTYKKKSNMKPCILPIYRGNFALRNVSNNGNDWQRLIPKPKSLKNWDTPERLFGVASVIQLIGFLSHEVLQLRALSLGSAIIYAVFHYSRDFYVGWFWCLTFIFANVWMISYLIHEKYHFNAKIFNKNELDIYNYYFKLGSLFYRMFYIYVGFTYTFLYIRHYKISYKEYYYLLKYASFETLNKDDHLCQFGVENTKLYLLLDGECGVYSDKNVLLSTLKGNFKDQSTSSRAGVFVGEISLIDDTQSKKATATVQVSTNKCEVMSWNFEDISRLIKGNEKDLLGNDIFISFNLINVFTGAMYDSYIKSVLSTKYHHNIST